VPRNTSDEDDDNDDTWKPWLIMDSLWFVVLVIYKGRLVSEPKTAWLEVNQESPIYVCKVLSIQQWAVH
jgi:hypothetical protein